LEAVAESGFKVLTYTEAIECLKKSNVDFKYPYEWGSDLKTEHERYICEQIAKGPVFITDYPKDIKAFYMRMNDDGKTVAACDMLVPGVGELIGGSQREERYDHLVRRMNEMGIPLDPLKWYVDLRRFGTVKHAGFGVGLERFILYLTGIGNIRDTIPYPRTPGNIIF
ncbi:MAG: asparagine--tRNA ligase, partial [Clostridiales bacterium]|nr:asparagine--tRNA ligase [Clostridiales bacterium]